MDKTCIECGKPLILGDFARDQNTCWDCFKSRVIGILEHLNGKERETVVWLLTLAGELYGKTW